MRRSSLIPWPLAAILGAAVAIIPVEFSPSNLRLSLSQAEAAPVAKGKQKARGKRRAPVRKKNARRGKAPAAVAVPKIDPQHVAPEIVEDAGKKSPLELLVDYKRTAREGDLETAAVLLKLAAQKPVTDVLVGEINVLLGVPLDSQDSAALVEISGTARTAAMANQVAPDNAASSLSERLEHAHSATASMKGAAVGSAVERLAAYKRAVTADNMPAAVIALTAAAKVPIDDDVVSTANNLLHIDMASDKAADLTRLAQAQVLAF